MPKCVILSGIPCSGKSTYANKQGGYILSCDKIRTEFYGLTYDFDFRKEDRVWHEFYGRVAYMKDSFIIDNTNCKPIYIQKIKETLSEDFEIEIKRFDISLWKAHYRNILRYWKTGKYIPFSVINNMYKNYKNLWSTSGLHQTLTMDTKT